MTPTHHILRLGTRNSPLAMTQANLVRNTLVAAHPALEIEIVPVVASGDKVTDRPLSSIGGKAMWTKELDAWLYEGHIDISVHSMKDVETLRSQSLTIAAIMPRADVRDRIVGATSLAELPAGARLGTSAPRRIAQVKRLRPDLNVVLFRGNVNTRLMKLKEGLADATMLAAAGLDRLGHGDIGTAIEIETLLPAPAQGAIGIECRSDDAATQTLLERINHKESYETVMAERAFLKALNATCYSPVAALAEWDDGHIMLRAEIYSEDGREAQSGAVYFEAQDAEAPARLAMDMLERAHPEIRALFTT
jgi:hydroxymethylbilane synthase